MVHTAKICDGFEHTAVIGDKLYAVAAALQIFALLQFHHGNRAHVAQTIQISMHGFSLANAFVDGGDKVFYHRKKAVVVNIVFGAMYGIYVTV